MTDAAATIDRDRLTDCEKVIAAGMATFVDVGTALAEIRDTRLYLATHKTFEAYCRDRWGMDRTYAHRTIEAAEVTKRLLSMGNTPTNERQVRPLTALPAEQQVTAWKVATAKAAAAERPVTAKDVALAVRQITNPTPKEEPQQRKRGSYEDWKRLRELVENIKAAAAEIDGLRVDVQHRIPARDLCESLSASFAKLAQQLVER